MASGIQLVKYITRVLNQWWILDCGTYVGFDGWILEVCS